MKYGTSLNSISNMAFDFSNSVYNRSNVGLGLSAIWISKSNVALCLRANLISMPNVTFGLIASEKSVHRYFYEANFHILNNYVSTSLFYLRCLTAYNV